jgi:hypothetical protein
MPSPALRLQQIDATQQQCQFFLAEQYLLAFGFRPVETPLLQTLGAYPQSTAIPEQQLQAIPLRIREQENVPAERLALQPVAHQTHTGPQIPCAYPSLPPPNRCASRLPGQTCSDLFQHSHQLHQHVRIKPAPTSIRRAFDSSTIRSLLPCPTACFAPDSSTRMNRLSADELSCRCCRRFRYRSNVANANPCLTQNSCRVRPLASYSATN